MRLHKTYFAHTWYISYITGTFLCSSKEDYIWIVVVHKICHLKHTVLTDFLYVNFSDVILTIQSNLNRYFSLFFQGKVRCEREGRLLPEMEVFLLSRLQKIMSTFSFEQIPMDKQAPKIMVPGTDTIGIVFVVSVCSVFRKRENIKVLCKAHFLTG